MLRVAAFSGLKPAEYFDLSDREFEVWLEGRADFMDRVMEIGAWMQANLMNVHIPRGKPRATVDKLLPRSVKQRRNAGNEEKDLAALAETLIEDPKERRLAREARLREEAAQEEARRFRDTPEGRRIRQLVEELAGGDP